MDYDHVKKQLSYGIQTESKDNAIKAIEQLTARVRELEEEQRIAELIAELEHIREQKNRLWFEFSIATQQLATLKAELREICAAIDDPASDLTLTTVECIKKLKAENESLKLDAEQWRAYQKRKQDLLDRGFLRSPLREEAELNPAMTQGEKP